MRQMLKRPAPLQTGDSSSSRSALIFSNILGLARSRVDPDLDLYGSASLDPNEENIRSTALNQGCLKKAYIMERLDQSHRHPKLEVPRLTWSGR
jgi:hypothetical protein